nr:MAG: replication initiator protein [Microvirus sp.]
MACYKPVPTWRSKQENASGKRSLVFSENQGIDGTRMEIPCGNCIGCRLDRAAEWQSRLIHESKMHTRSCFLTCTYDEAHLPHGGTLVKKHFQDFMKRLRKHYGSGIRFFACGEYGDNTRRPHYHALIFNLDFVHDQKKYAKGSQGDTIYTSKSLDDIWTHGRCYIGTVTPDSCGYVARYVMKKVNGQLAQDHYKNVDTKTGEIHQLLPEYIHMSTRPAIGLTFYEAFKDEIIQSDFVLVRGKKRKTPRYYDKQLEKENPDLLEDLKYLRSVKAKQRSADNTDERLAVREQVKLASIKPLKRTME